MLAALALASVLTVDSPCYASAFYDRLDKLSLHRVTAPGRTHFRLDNEAGKPCDTAGCRLKAYLIRGDEVVVSHQQGGFACVWFKPPPRRVQRGKREIDPIKFDGPATMGWLPVAALEPVAVSAVSPTAAWDGEWVGEAQILDITPKGERRLAIKGMALFAFDAERLAMGAVHDGQIDGLYFRDGDFAEGAEDFMTAEMRRPTGDEEQGCVLRLRRLGRYVVVDDNLRCGGLNVTFSGLYHRGAGR